jgi:hypothetical protein
MRYVIITLLILAGLQASRGQFMAALSFLILAVGTHAASTGHQRS